MGVWKTLGAGAGGLITALDMHADGTLVCRTDVYGGYYYDRAAANPGNAGGTGCWRQLITASSMASYPSLVTYPAYMANGLHEIRIAPSNSQIFYMVYLGWVWFTTNRGATWTQTAYTQTSAAYSNANAGAQRTYRYKMAIDPINPDVVYFANYNLGPSVTLNGTGAGTWNAISGLASVDGNEVCCVAIDPSSSTTSGRKSIVYISISGTGLYKSTTGGGSGTYSLVSGTPTIILELWVNSNGVLFCSDDAGRLWRLVGSTWTNITPSSGSVSSIAIDPANPKRILACPYAAAPRETADAEITTPVWSSPPPVPAIMNGPDAPMCSTLYFNPSNWTAGVQSGTIDPITGNLWVSANQGIWRTPLPLSTSTQATLTSVISGIEEIVANVVIVPPGNAPLLLGHDIGILRQPDVTKYLPHQNWYRSNFLSFGAWADYASNNPNFVAAVADAQGGQYSGYSTDGGDNWQLFANVPAGTHYAGSIACATSTEIIWIQSTDGQPWHTSNGGTTAWTAITGLPTNGWQSGWYCNQCEVVADRVNIGTFYLQHGGTDAVPTNAGTYVVTNNGATVNFYSNKISSTTFDSATVGNPNNGGAFSLLKSVPGNAGHLFFCSGYVGGGGVGGNLASQFPHSAKFWYSHDGGQHWFDVSGLSSNNWTIREVWTYGFGKAAAGQTYPAIYIYGFVAVGSSPLPPSSPIGLWATYDNCVTWTQIDGPNPNGWLDWMKCVNGDMSIYGRIYVGYNGSGWFYTDTAGGGGPAGPIIHFRHRKV